MNALEARYRRALNWYPKAWRAQNGEAILGVLMDGAEGRTQPRAGDIVNLAANGLLTRLAPLADIVPRGVRDAASSLALGFGFGLTITMLVMQEWAPWAPTSTMYYPEPASLEPVASPMVGPFSGWGALLYLTWIIGGLFFAAGKVHMGRWTLVATIPGSVALVLLAGNTNGWSRPPTLALAVLLSLVVIVAAGRPLQRRGQWMAVALSSGLGAVAVAYPIVTNHGLITRLDPQGGWSLVTGGAGLGGALALLAVLVLLGTMFARRWDWAGAILVISAPWIAITLAYVVARGDALAMLAAAVALTAIAAIAVARHLGYRLTREPRDANAVD